MKTLCYPTRARRQDGSVAVEAALIISLILVPMVAFILLFGRYFWYYSIAQKAAHDATMYLANAPIGDIRSYAAKTLADNIMNAELADMDRPTRATLGPTVECLYRIPANAPFLSSFNCNTINSALVQVRVSISITVHDPFLSRLTNALIGQDGLPIMTQTTMRYVGR
jgi:Flp pilus assembly protein TadG